MNKKIKINKIISIYVLLGFIYSTFFNFSYAGKTDTINQFDASAVQSTSSDSILNSSESSDLSANSTQSKPTVLSKAAILIDSYSGQILYEHNSNEQLYPASTTKLMTAILTLENCQLSDTVTVNPKALMGIPRTYTTAALQPNEALTIEQLLHVLLIPSANDAANVLAFHIAGSIEDFSIMMNAKAKELGCQNTHFENPSGIHSDNHYSTAYDMALIGKYANTFDEIKQITSTTSYSLPNLPDGTERNFKTTNTLITPKNKYYYEYATGMKTGYTDKAKSCIVAKAKKEDVELICVILGGDKTEDNKNQRELDCHTLFDYGFNNYSYEKICTKDETLDMSNLDNIPDIYQDKDIKYSDDLSVLSDSQSTDNIDTNISWTNENLPIYKDQVIGTVTYNINNTDYKMNLLAGEDILPTESKHITTVYYALCVILVLLILMIIINKRKNRFHKKGKYSREPKYFRHSFY